VASLAIEAPGTEEAERSDPVLVGV
jgi:hypothetical protein